MADKKKQTLPEALKRNMWLPGQSGNPKGRPKRPTFEMLVASILDEKVPGAGVTKREALARVFVDMMLKRDGGMVKEYLLREWPKALEIELIESPQSPHFIPSEAEQAAVERDAIDAEDLH